MPFLLSFVFDISSLPFSFSIQWYFSFFYLYLSFLLSSLFFLPIIMSIFLGGYIDYFLYIFSLFDLRLFHFPLSFGLDSRPKSPTVLPHFFLFRKSGHSSVAIFWTLTESFEKIWNHISVIENNYSMRFFRVGLVFSLLNVLSKRFIFLVISVHLSTIFLRVLPVHCFKQTCHNRIAPERKMLLLCFALLPGSASHQTNGWSPHLQAKSAHCCMLSTDLFVHWNICVAFKRTGEMFSQQYSRGDIIFN